MPVFTNDQIADHLTNGYWGGTARSFDATAGDTLYVDITKLTAAGQDMARAALQAWSDASGLIFVETDSTSPPVTTHTEGADAAPDTATAYTMAVGDDFLGNLACVLEGADPRKDDREFIAGKAR